MNESDFFADKAGAWDAQPVPRQISEGVWRALSAALPLTGEEVALDLGAGTGLLSERLAPRVRSLLAVDTSPSMLAELARKPALAGRVEALCQDLASTPLGRQVDLVVSAMALHHIEDTGAILRALAAALVPGGRLALADLDAEDGDFHPAEAVGVHHAGFDRGHLGRLLEDAGFEAVVFQTACEVARDGKRWPIFLVTARRAA
jgi:putative AdoMet-dependent methyltransferase